MGVTVSASAFPAGLRTVRTWLTAVATLIGASHKRILFARKVISFINFGEAPLRYMLFSTVSYKAYKQLQRFYIFSQQKSLQAFSLRAFYRNTAKNYTA